MEETRSIEKIAEENSNLAKMEKDSGSEMKTLAKQVVKRAKAREMLVKNELDLAKIRERLAEKSKKLVERKEKVKNLLNLGENILKAEKTQAIYNEKVAEIKNGIKDHRKKFSRKSMLPDKLDK